MWILVSGLRTWLAQSANISGFTKSLTTQLHIFQAYGHVLGAVSYNEVPRQHQGCSHVCLWHPGMLTNPVLSQTLFLEIIIPPCVFLLYLHFTARLLTFNSLYQRACLQNHCLLPPSYSVSHLNSYN